MAPPLAKEVEVTLLWMPYYQTKFVTINQIILAMKKLLSFTLPILVVCSVIAVLFSSHISRSTPKIVTARSSPLTKVALTKLVDEASQDPISRQITRVDLNRMIQVASNHALADEKRWQELSKKDHFSEEDTKYIVASLGFNDMSGFRNYANLFVSLAKKFDVTKLMESDQKSFFNAFRSRELQYVADSNLLPRAAFPGGIRPECWKCVVDYQSCLQPYIGAVQTNIQNTTTVEIEWQGGTITATQFNPTVATILYVNNTVTPSQCISMYHTCISTCYL